MVGVTVGGGVGLGRGVFVGSVEGVNVGAAVAVGGCSVAVAVEGGI